MRKFDMKTLQICPPHLSDVAILPWEIEKVIFQHYYSYRPTSDYLRYLKKQIAAVVLLLSASYYLYSPVLRLGLWGTLQEERMY